MNINLSVKCGIKMEEIKSLMCDSISDDDGCDSEDFITECSGDEPNYELVFSDLDLIIKKKLN